MNEARMKREIGSGLLSLAYSRALQPEEGASLAAAESRHQSAVFAQVGEQSG